MLETANRIPRPALVLGGAGLIPFVALAVLSWVPRSPHHKVAVMGLAAYGRAILSFMGGADWGLAMGRRAAPLASQARSYAISVLPALAAWLTAGLEVASALMGLAMGLALLLAYDMWTAHRGEAPAWYPRLRIPLSLVAITCLALTGLS